MAWRPNENLIDGKLDNRTPGKVTGWMRFFRRNQRPLKVTFDLEGDFHEDIRGKIIVLRNPQPSDWNIELDRAGTYMEGFAPVQRGTVGDITAGLPLGRWTEALAQKLKAKLEIMWQANGISGAELQERRQEIDAAYAANIAAGKLYYPYVAYPYIEWYSDNGRVVLELDPGQIEIIDIQGPIPRSEKTAAELAGDEKRRAKALGDFMSGMVRDLSEENRREGGNGNVSGIVAG